MEEPIATRRGRRSLRTVNYKELDNLRLPKESVTKSKEENKLYPITVVEQENNKVKVHYVGYSSDFDEWKKEDELECLPDEEEEASHTTTAAAIEPYQPYSLFRTLRLKIKQALTCGRKASPVINIVMPFDKMQFDGGLKTAGILSKTVQGVQHYKISHYRDLNPWLGSRWHYRGLNDAGDYGYVVLETVDFCLRKSRSLVEYLPPSCPDQPNEKPSKFVVDTGFCVSFCFVSNYGSHSTFGKDKSIFYE